MKDLIAWWVKNPVAANLLMIAIILMGITGHFKLQREFFPEVTANGMSVFMAWQGASPRDIEEQLVTRIEEAVDGLDGIDYIESTAREGSAEVNIRTKVRADYERILDEVKIRIDGINNFPSDAFRPQVFRWDARADYMYVAMHGDIDRLTLQRMATELRFEISKLPGAQLARQISKIPEQVTIEVSEKSLRQYNLTFSQVSQAIAGSSVNLSAGTVETSGGNLQLRARSLANTQAEFESIVIRQTPDGGIIRVKDIANVIDGFDDDQFTAKFRGENTAIFQVLSPDTMNITESGKAFRQFEKDINKKLPPGVQVTVWFDGSTMFDSRMNMIGSNAISGMLLVLIVLMLFLRPAVAAWVTVGIATAFAGAVAIAPVIGVTLNMISLFAFLLVIGIVVDDAIVVGESVHYHVEHNISGEKGAILGGNMVVKPVFFAVITTIMMFMPWMLLSGPVSAWSSQITLVVIATLVFSLIEAFFILPAHLRNLKPLPPSDQLGGIMRFQRKLADGLMNFAQTRFRPFVARLIHYRYITLTTFIALFIFFVSLLVAGVAPKAMLPEVESDLISVNIRFPEGTNYERIEQVRTQLDTAIEKINNNTMQDFNVDYDLITHPGTFSDSRTVDGFLGLTNPSKRENISTKDLADKLEEYLGPVPDALRVNFGATEAGSEGGLRYGIASNDTKALADAILDIKSQLDTYDAVTRTWDGLESSAQEMQFVLKPGAESLGITLAGVTSQVREAFYGREVQRLPRNGEDVRVMVRYPESARDSIDSLKNLRIRGANGVEVPLYSVAEVNFADGISRISRRDRKQLNYVGARVKGKGAELEELKKDMTENFFPEWTLRHPNVSRVLVGDDDLTRTMNSELLLSTMVVFAMMFGLLAIAFKSYSQPLLIMIAIPFAFVGMIFGTLVTGITFGIMSWFGFFAAAGVAINDNLVLIDYANRLRAKGLGSYQAMLEACVARFRPILLTSVTTFVGITPMLFETSTQAEFLKPMVVALAFGVLFDFFLTLMLVPAMYGIGIDIKRVFKGGWQGKKYPPLGSSYDPNLQVSLEELDIVDKPLEGKLQTQA